MGEYVIERAEWWWDRQNLPEPIEVEPELLASYLVATMRRNPATNWCRQRGCSHRFSAHNPDGLCMVETCPCPGLVEDVAA